MKRLLFILPLSLISVGCGSSSQVVTSDNDNSASAASNTVASSSTDNSATDNSATPAALSVAVAKPIAAGTAKPAAAAVKPSGTPAKTASAAPVVKPDPSYPVVDPDHAGLPDEIVAALKTVVVPPPPANMNVPAKPEVILSTSKGDITVLLDPKAAPLHTKSFLYLAKRGFYNGTVFHRRQDLTNKGGFIVQGGDPFTRNAKYQPIFGMGGPGYRVPREVNKLTHDALMLAMARSQDPDSAGSQFYITQGPVHFLDPDYTVFGKVVAGQSAAMALEKDDLLKSAKVVSSK